MKKIFLLLILFLSFSFLNVQADSLEVKKPSKIITNNKTCSGPMCGSYTSFSSFYFNSNYGFFYGLQNSATEPTINYENEISFSNIASSLYNSIFSFSGFIHVGTSIGNTDRNPITSLNWSGNQSCTFNKVFDEYGDIVYSFSCLNLNNSQGNSLFVNFSNAYAWTHLEVSTPLSFSIIHDSQSNNQEIIDNQNQNTQDILDSQEQNKQDILDNQNQNTQDVIDNQNKNNEELQGTIKDQFNTCRDSRNLYNYKDIRTISSGISADDDGWITAYYDNTNGSSEIWRYYRTNNLNLKPNTKYNIFLEVKDISGNGIINEVGTDSQFNGTIGYDFNILSKNAIRQFTLITNETFSNNNGLNTYVRFKAGQSGTITFRISVLEDPSITTSSFQYEPYGEQICTNKLDEAENTRKGILGKLGDLFTSVLELPSKLINLLIDALKSLFVPTDEQLLEIINDSKELTENFGFVGESMNFFINIFTSLLGMTNQRGCLEFPEFTLPLSKTGLADDVVFWKAQNVCLADNPILSENIDTIRSITSIVLVGLFIGFASSKFFTILSKNDVANDTSGVSWEQDGDEVYRTEYWRRGTNSFSKRSRYR